MTTRLRVLLSLGFLLGALVPLHAEEEEQAKRPIFTSLAEARREAAKEDELILVVLDPEEAEWYLRECHGAYPRASLEEAAELLVVARLSPGVENPESVAIRTRYDLQDDLGAALIIDRDGALYGFHDAFSLADWRQGLADAVDARANYRRARKMLEKRSGREARKQLAGLHFALRNFEPAVEVVAELDAEAPLDAAELEYYAYALLALGRTAEARDVFARLIEDYSADDRLVDWRIGLALHDMCFARVALLRFGREDAELRGRGLDALRPLLAAVQAEDDVPAEAAVRGAMLAYLSDPVRKVACCDWILRKDPTGPSAAGARGYLYEMAVAWNDPATARQHLTAMIAALPEGDDYALHAREGLLPALDRDLAEGEDPEQRPLLLDLNAMPFDGGVTLTVRVENRSRTALRDLTVGYTLAGEAELLTGPSVHYDTFAPGKTMEIHFQLRPIGEEPVHVLVLAERSLEGKRIVERGKHLRLEPASR